MRVAIVGGGIAGIGAARALSNRFEIALYEAGDRLGGNARTVSFPSLDGGIDHADMGVLLFMPLLYSRVCEEMRAAGVRMQSIRSLSYTIELADGTLWTSNGTPSPHLEKMRPEAERFVRECETIVRTKDQYRGVSARAYLERAGYPEKFGDDFLAPILSCLFLFGSAQLEMPIVLVATTFVFEMNAFSPIRGYCTVFGGTERYVERFVEPFLKSVRLKTEVVSVRRASDGVHVRDAGGHEDRFDAVIVATSAEQARALLEDRSADEDRLLGAVRYKDAKNVLHRDRRLMPRDPAMWAPFFYKAAGDQQAHHYTYRMRDLQEWIRDEVFATFDPPDGLVPEEMALVHQRWRHVILDWRHDLLMPELATLQGKRRTWFAGEYLRGSGHEEAYVSALDAAADLERVLGAAHS